MKKVAVFALVLAVSACSKAPEDAPSGETAPATASVEPDSNDPKVVLAQCVVCHKLGAAEGNSLGPNLHGVVGRKAGAVANFNYSPAMKDSGLTWDEATLDKYLTKPMELVKGTKMAYAGQGDPAKRKEIIDWLKEQK